MCGIVCALDLKQKADELRPQMLEMAKKSGTADLIGVEFIVAIRLFWLMNA
jgi:hypothetical protein